jgi:hypothetical protein
MPTIGDLAGDGKVNFLLYDIDGDGNSAGSSYTAGFFSSGDFFVHSGGDPRNNLDMMHIDIGRNQGFRAFDTTLTSAERATAELQLLNILAHEFQHMLFYMYFDVYTDNAVWEQYLWLNEMLSELAGAFYARSGAEVADFSRLSWSAQNSYAGSDYGDFLNFNNSLKNYGMSMLFGMLMYKTYGEAFPQRVYNNFITTFPPVQNNPQLAAHRNRINADGHDLTVGRALRAGTGGAVGTDETALSLLYFLFMENFAADGGVIDGTQSTKFYAANNPVDNLWAIRPVMGLSNGRVLSALVADNPIISPPFPSAFSLSSSSAFPTLTSGGNITLNGYSGSIARGATHEMFYRLTGGTGTSPVLNITPPLGSSAERYYAVIPNSPLIETTNLQTNVVFSNGTGGANVYPLTRGELNQIDTGGRPAYLFVVTFYGNVSSSITYSWSVPVHCNVCGQLESNCICCSICGNFPCECHVVTLCDICGKNPCECPPPLTGLAAAISQAQSLSQADYTAASWTRLQTALTNAVRVQSSTSFNQAAIDSAESTLRLRLSGLVPIGEPPEPPPPPPTFNRDNLRNAIQQAESLNQANFTAANWTRLQTALDNAKRVYSGTNFNQAAIDSADATLRLRISAGN